jgi:hypothetical protein
MRKNPIDLRRRLYIQFKGEDGLDYGGVARLFYEFNVFFIMTDNIGNGFSYSRMMFLIQCIAFLNMPIRAITVFKLIQRLL